MVFREMKLSHRWCDKIYSAAALPPETEPNNFTLLWQVSYFYTSLLHLFKRLLCFAYFSRLFAADFAHILLAAYYAPLISPICLPLLSALFCTSNLAYFFPPLLSATECFSAYFAQHLQAGVLSFHNMSCKISSFEMLSNKSEFIPETISTSGT